MTDKDLLDKIIILTEDIVKLKMENVKLKEELKHDYSGKTIENIIKNIETILKYKQNNQ